jgi:hypothetical protein
MDIEGSNWSVNSSSYEPDTDQGSSIPSQERGEVNDLLGSYDTTNRNSTASAHSEAGGQEAPPDAAPPWGRTQKEVSDFLRGTSEQGYTPEQSKSGSSPSMYSQESWQSIGHLPNPYEGQTSRNENMPGPNQGFSDGAGGTLGLRPSSPLRPPSAEELSALRATENAGSAAQRDAGRVRNAFTGTPRQNAQRSAGKNNPPRERTTMRMFARGERQSTASSQEEQKPETFGMTRAELNRRFAPEDPAE